MTTALQALLGGLKKNLAAKRAGGKTAKIPDGTSIWRIMRSWRTDGSGVFWHEYAKHYIKGADEQLKESYICTKATFNRPCAVCDAVEKHSGMTHDENMKKVLDKMGVHGARYLVNAISMAARTDGSAPDVEVLEMPYTLFQQLIELADLYAKSGIDIFGAAGTDIAITRTGTGKNTKYQIMVAPMNSAVPPEYDAKVKNLDEFVSQENEGQLQLTISSIDGIVGGIAGLPAGMARPGGPALAFAPTPAAALPMAGAGSFGAPPTGMGGAIPTAVPGAVAPAPTAAFAAAPVAPPAFAPAAAPAAAFAPAAPVAMAQPGAFAVAAPAAAPVQFEDVPSFPVAQPVMAQPVAQPMPAVAPGVALQPAVLAAAPVATAATAAVAAAPLNPAAVTPVTDASLAAMLEGL